MKTANDLRKMSIAELKNEHLALLREQFNLRMQKGGGHVMQQTHQFKQVRRGIARILTVLIEKQKQQEHES